MNLYLQTTVFASALQHTRECKRSMANPLGNKLPSGGKIWVDAPPGLSRWN